MRGTGVETVMATVVLVGTLDTKGTEYGWLRDQVRELGCEVVLIDAGIGEPQIEADVPAAPDYRLHDVGAVPIWGQA